MRYLGLALSIAVCFAFAGLVLWKGWNGWWITWPIIMSCVVSGVSGK